MAAIRILAKVIASSTQSGSQTSSYINRNTLTLLCFSTTISAICWAMFQIHSHLLFAMLLFVCSCSCPDVNSIAFRILSLFRVVFGSTLYVRRGETWDSEPVTRCILCYRVGTQYSGGLTFESLCKNS
jgi:hypothetical protein